MGLLDMFRARTVDEGQPDLTPTSMPESRMFQQAAPVAVQPEKSGVAGFLQRFTGTDSGGSDFRDRVLAASMALQGNVGGSAGYLNNVEDRFHKRGLETQDKQAKQDLNAAFFNSFKTDPKTGKKVFDPQEWAGASAKIRGAPVGPADIADFMDKFSPKMVPVGKHVFKEQPFGGGGEWAPDAPETPEEAADREARAEERQARAAYLQAQRDYLRDVKPDVERQKAGAQDYRAHHPGTGGRAPGPAPDLSHLTAAELKAVIAKHTKK